MTQPSDHPPALPGLTRLSREAPISDVEEERTVRALRARGLLGRKRPRWPGRASRVALQLAAALVLFAGGIAVGVRVNYPPAPTVHADTASGGDAALAVQRAGTSFVQAIARVTTLDESPSSHEFAAAHEVAWNALQAAQTLLTRRAPFDSARGGPHVIWF